MENLDGGWLKQMDESIRTAPPDIDPDRVDQSFPIRKE
jgi:hypothetical protein